MYTCSYIVMHVIRMYTACYKHETGQLFLCIANTCDRTVTSQRHNRLQTVLNWLSRYRPANPKSMPETEQLQALDNPVRQACSTSVKNY